MIRKFQTLLFIWVIGFALCLTNGFGAEVPEPIFELRTADREEYIQGTEDIKRSPNFIFGTNDIEKMRDLPRNSQDYILGEKVAFLFTAFAPGSPRGFICTGFLVGPDLLMTNHHCVHDDFGRPAPLELIEIYMDYYQASNVDPTWGGITAGVTAIVRADALLDYALLRLDKPIGNTYGWLELDTTTPAIPGESVKIIHHSKGRSKEISRRNSQIIELPKDVAEENPFLIGYLADTEGGSSGSPIFHQDGTGVIGINHSGWFNRAGPIFNGGSLMSWIVPEIQQWLPDVTPPTPTANLMYWTDPGTSKIQRANLDGSNIENLITTGLTAPFSIALDIQNGKMYWTDPGTSKIQRANLDGSNIENLITTGLDSPTGIALDIQNGKMYWADEFTSKIQRANLDGSNIENLITAGVAEPFSIALDVAGNKMYWTDPGTSRIQRANLDGSNIENLITVGLEYPNGIALDIRNSKMYWIDYGTIRIQRANLDGSNIENLITTGLHSPTGIALDIQNSKMYWTDYFASKIQRANLDGSNIENLVTTGVQDPNSSLRGIALGIPPQPSGTLRFNPSTIADQNFTVGREVSLELPAPTGGTRPYTYTLTPNLPAGLYFDPVSDSYGFIGGIPTTPMPLTLFTYTARDATGASATLKFTIQVTEDGPGLRFNPSSIPDQTLRVGTPAFLILPIATGGTAPYIYIIRPSLPAGLQYDNTTRVLSGTPTTITPRNTYTYTAADATGASATLTFTIEVKSAGGGNLDVNADGQITVLDLAIVALFYGVQVPQGVSLPADVNADGVVNLLDLTAVAQAIDAQGFSAAPVLSLQEAQEAFLAAAAQAEEIEAVAEAPTGFVTLQNVLFSRIAYRNVAAALADAKRWTTDDGQLGKKLTVLEELLALIAEMVAIPGTTALLPNYPNPFNPETWIPYHLSYAADVVLTIYNVQGDVVRQLMLGQQSAGVYESRGRAAFWDGKNASGEPVASGVYFYTLTAGDFAATRKLLIRK